MQTEQIELMHFLFSQFFHISIAIFQILAKLQADEVLEETQLVQVVGQVQWFYHVFLEKVQLNLCFKTTYSKELYVRAVLIYYC